MNDALGSPQSVLLLGGSSEIGLAVTRKLVGRRAKTVILAGRDPEALKPAADDLRASGADTVDVVAFDALAKRCERTNKFLAGPGRIPCERTNKVRRCKRLRWCDSANWATAGRKIAAP